MSSEKIENVTFVVTSTQTEPHDYPADQPLRAAVERAFGETHTRDRDLSGWVLEVNGKAIDDLNQTFKEAGIQSGAQLRLRRSKPGVSA